MFGHKRCLHEKSVTLVRGGGAEVNDAYGAILTRVWGGGIPQLFSGISCLKLELMGQVLFYLVFFFVCGEPVL